MVTVSGATTWTGGTMTGTGVTNASGGLTIGGTAANTNYQVQLTRTLNNPGTGQIERSVTGGGFSTTLFIDSGGTFDNQPGASFAFTDDGTNVSFASGARRRFRQRGYADQGREHRHQLDWREPRRTRRSTTSARGR